MDCVKKVLVLNGEIYKYYTTFNVLSLLNYLGFKTELVVIDHNGTILQKEFWSNTKLKNNDTLEILTVAGGG